MIRGFEEKGLYTDFEYAEFNHMTRNYEKALKFYDQTIQHFKGEKSFNSSEAIKRQLSLYVMSLGQPEEAYKYLKTLEGDKKLDYFTKSDLKDWVKSLHEWNQKQKILEDKITGENIENYVERVLDTIEDVETLVSEEKDRVIYLGLQRKLNDFLNSNPSPSTVPVALYWLSLIERKLNYNLFFSFGDLLLKECIISYTRHPYAKKCYQEYKNQMIFSFSGSGGLHLPDEVKMELDLYKKKIYGEKPHKEEKKNVDE